MMTALRLSVAVVLGLSIAGFGISAMAQSAKAPPADRPPAAPQSAAPAQSSPDAGPPQPAKVPAEVMVLHATNTDGGIDPRIGPMPQLRKPPFSSYNTYSLIARNSVTLSTAQPETTRLPNGRLLKTSLLGAVPKDRYRISTSISQPSADGGTQNFLPLLEVTAKSGETFFVAGQSYRGGMLVVGIKVGASR